MSGIGALVDPQGDVDSIFFEADTAFIASLDLAGLFRAPDGTGGIEPAKLAHHREAPALRGHPCVFINRRQDLNVRQGTERFKGRK